jgi:hypothetical protein
MKVNFYTLQTPKARRIIGIFCISMQKNPQVQQAASGLSRFAHKDKD